MIFHHTLWLTGLPSSGKTTLAQATQVLLNSRKIASVLIDGDEFRLAFCSDLGFSPADRMENIRRAANMAKMVNDSGVIAICSFVSPTLDIRLEAKNIIGNDRFHEVYLNAPLYICQQRDTKGLYKKASQGLLSNLTGVGSPYEPPQNPLCKIDTSEIDPNQAAQKLLEYFWKKIIPNQKRV
jgi:adenylyl-sulfate kinase